MSLILSVSIFIVDCQYLIHFIVLLRLVVWMSEVHHRTCKKWNVIFQKWFSYSFSPSLCHEWSCLLLFCLSRLCHYTKSESWLQSELTLHIWHKHSTNLSSQCSSQLNWPSLGSQSSGFGTLGIQFLQSWHWLATNGK